VPHLILPLCDLTLAATIERVQAAHDFLVGRAAEVSVALHSDAWGVKMKRLQVPLAIAGRPRDIGKEEEGLVELVNMTATAERMLGALRWLAVHPTYSVHRVRECHPTTSDVAEGNDLVLMDPDRRPSARVEVCDVVSSKRDSNEKERKSLTKLGCPTFIPRDGVDRFLAASPEFALKVCRGRRYNSWLSYRRYNVGDNTQTAMLQLCQPDALLLAPADPTGDRRRGSHIVMELIGRL
jgi:hypothetical protein